MNLRSIPLVLLALILPSCGLLPKSHTDSPSEIKRSNHTLQELCDFPKQFYATKFHAESLRVGVIATKPLTEKIGTGNGCDYHTADDSDYLGYIFLDAPPAVTPSATAGAGTPRTLMVDDVSVTDTPQTQQALPPFTTAPTQYALLSATIDGWRGEFELLGRDEQTIQAGAETLVHMIRALKN
ncbi:hypothetical protein [Nocardia vinacea]|uniref:hypothetical protein n=1 Tax=Nocardia vinacea TaxID=96468 RepID=UPI0012F6B08B|nr:hypothetical protein [Nocardia vinacea]